VTPEAALERDGIALLRSLGFVVYRLSQGYRAQRGGTRQTLGLPDVYALHPAKQIALWWEAKTPDRAAKTARLLARPPHTIPKSSVSAYRTGVAQREFGQRCRAANHPYAYGALDALVAELTCIGFGLTQLRMAA
jgi:hypothetical protein